MTQSAVDAFTRLTPPTDPELVIETITVVSLGRGGGRSRKAGNIYLNWPKLIDIVPDTAIAAAGALTSPTWLMPLIGLHVWNKLCRGAEEHLTEVEACIVFALWRNKNGQNEISEDEGFIKDQCHPGTGGHADVTALGVRCRNQSPVANGMHRN